MVVSNVEYGCGVCNWVYRPSEHNGIEFADVASDWICPNCQAEQDQFSVYIPTSFEIDDLENAANGTSFVESASEFPPEQRVIYTKKVEPSIFELHRQWQLGELNVQPEFQRYYVWSPKQESRLVESIFLNVPIPLV
jgi:rubredoxin